MKHFTGIFLLLFLPSLLLAQLLNPSFETGSGVPTLSGWEDLCGLSESVEDAPAGGGDWCLRLATGNFQGCYPGYFTQDLPALPAGGTVTASVWVKTEANFPAGIGFKWRDNNSWSGFIVKDTATSPIWKQITISASIPAGILDTLQLVLHSGIVTGPLVFYSRYDLVSLDITTGLPPHPDPFQLIGPIPNPAENFTQLRWDPSLEIGSSFHIQITDLAGKTLYRTRVAVSQGAHRIPLQTLSPGIFLLFVRSDTGKQLCRKLEVL